jgi:DNA polymerase
MGNTNTDRLHIDFETRSEVDLKTAGVYNYASSLDTEILMMGYAFNDDPPEVWLPDRPFPQRIKDHIRKGFDLHAFNAQFERLVWAYILSQDFDDIPNPTLRQWKCTAAQARVHGLPKKLGDAARCLGLPMQKMPEGTRLLKAYSAPGHTKDIPPDDLALLVEYCATDVEVERMLGQCLRELTDEEWEVFWTNEEINDRGLPIDVSLTRAATKYGDAVRLEADARIVASTQGAVTNARKRKTRDDWLSLRLTDAQDAILREDGKIKFGKPLREELLLCDDLDPNVREFVMAVEEAGGATISKYEAFTNRSMDGRLYGAFMYAGGGQTGRFSSIGVQVHNLKREGHKDPEKAIQKVMDGADIDSPSEHLAKLIRAVIAHPDGLVWADYSNIEGRVAPWLAKSAAGEKKLDVFRAGKDPYRVNAAELFNVAYEDVTDEQRQSGKVQELSLGFIGGAGALLSMAKQFKMPMTQSRAETLRDAWRSVNNWAVPYGADLIQAAKLAYYHPGAWFDAGRLAYGYDGQMWLWCRLPSGRLLAYLAPKMELVKTPWGDEVLGLTVVWGGGKAKVGQPWPRRPLTPGLLLENGTQATAACLLRTAIVNACHAGIEVVGHVHDEIIAQNTTEEELLKYVLDAPAWADGLPIEAKPSSGVRYGK